MHFIILLKVNGVKLYGANKQIIKKSNCCILRLNNFDYYFEKCGANRPEESMIKNNICRPLYSYYIQDASKIDK